MIMVLLIGGPHNGKTIALSDEFYDSGRPVVLLPKIHKTPSLADEMVSPSFTEYSYRRRDFVSYSNGQEKVHSIYVHGSDNDDPLGALIELAASRNDTNKEVPESAIRAVWEHGFDSAYGRVYNLSKNSLNYVGVRNEVLKLFADVVTAENGYSEDRDGA